MDTQSIQTEQSSDEQPTNSAHIVVLQNDYQVALGYLETAYSALNQVADPEARAQAQAALIQVNEKYNQTLQVASQMDLFVLGIGAQIETLKSEIKAMTEELELVDERVVEAADSSWSLGYDSAIDDLYSGDLELEGITHSDDDTEEQLSEAQDRIIQLEKQLAEKQAALEANEAVLAELERLSKTQG